MAAKEKGKIVSASPDSPTLEKLSTFSQQIRSALHCFSAVATRTNALWQRAVLRRWSSSSWSQPARMRCGKGTPLAVCHQSLAVATRTNALWQRRFDRKLFLELLVATRTNALWQRKDVTFNNIADFVATRTNALWQRSNICAIFALAAVATRTNALWQRTALRKLQWRVLKSQPARMRCGKGNKPLE